MTPPLAPLHAGSHLPMALDRALLVLGVAAVVFVGVAYLFYVDNQAVFREVER